MFGRTNRVHALYKWPSRYFTLCTGIRIFEKTFWGWQQFCIISCNAGIFFFLYASSMFFNSSSGPDHSVVHSVVLLWHRTLHQLSLSLHFHMASHNNADEYRHLIPFFLTSQHYQIQASQPELSFSDLIHFLPFILSCHTLKQDKPWIIISPHIVQYEYDTWLIKTRTFFKTKNQYS